MHPSYSHVQAKEHDLRVAGSGSGSVAKVSGCPDASDALLLPLSGIPKNYPTFAIFGGGSFLPTSERLVSARILYA